MYDFALHPETGDWLFAANADIQGVSGEQVIEQRIRTRLRISQPWDLDPTNGTLGSSIREMARLQRGRIVRELPLAIKEALAPMTDIQIQDVAVSEYGDTAVLVEIEYLGGDPEIEPSAAEHIQRTLSIQIDL